MPITPNETKRLDTMRINDRVVFNLYGAKSCTIQASQIVRNGTGSSDAVMTVQRSNDGVTWGAMTRATTVVAGAMTNKLDVEGFSYVSASVSTVDSGGGVTVSPVEVLITKSDNLVSWVDAFSKFQNVTASRLLGRGAAAGTGETEEVTLGTNLSFTGTTLNASGGASTGIVPPTATATAGLLYIDTAAGRFYWADGADWLYVTGTVYVPTPAPHPVGMITRLTAMGVPGRRV